MTEDIDRTELTWTRTIEFEHTVWYASVEDWRSVPPWPWRMAEVRFSMASYEATLTDPDYIYLVWLGQYKTPERAQIAIERALEVMRSSSNGRVS